MVAVLEVGILALIISPVLRAALHPSLRRAFPKTAGVIGATVLLGLAVAVALAVRIPQLLHLTTGLALAGTAWAVWHARPNAGRRRRQPPGSLSMLPFGYLTDPFFLQKQMDRYGPVFKMSQFGIGAGPNPFRGFVQPVCCVDLKRGIAILQAHDQRLHPTAMPSSRFIPRKYLREMGRDDHRRYRQMFSTAFSPEVVDENAAFMAGHIRASLLRMADAFSSNGARGLAPEPFLIETMVGIFARCFFGIAPDDARFGRVEELIGVIALSNRNARQVTLALEELAAILRQEARRIAESAGSGPRSFLGELVVREPEALDDLSAMRNLIYIMQAAWTDASGLIVWLFKELCEHPEWTARLAGHESEATAGADPLSLRYVKETLRLRQSEYLYRKVLDDVPVDGFVIPKGWLLRVCVRESHRDPRVFEEAQTFNPDRFLGGGFPREKYSTFGASRIYCLGEHLTLTLGRIFVREVAATVEASTLRDGPPEYRSWHWKPSSKWTAGVSPLLPAC